MFPFGQVLFNVSGTQDKPATNVSIHGLTLRDTAFTYMDPHGLPSGGDWGLQKQVSSGLTLFQGHIYFPLCVMHPSSLLVLQRQVRCGLTLMFCFMRAAFDQQRNASTLSKIVNRSRFLPPSP